jgi:membrane-anchored mycosin MYCP
MSRADARSRGPLQRAATVLALVAALSGVAVVTAPAALAACRQPVSGRPLPPGAGQDPLIDRLGLRRLWELSTGRGVTVAVVDSGVDARHPKLAGAVDPPTDFRASFTTAAGFEQGPGTGDDCQNHGTPIAGIIAARAAGDERVRGIAPEARIAPVRFDGSLAQAPPEMIAAAIRAGADRGSVLNLSFAVGDDKPAIRKAVQYALDHDVVVVAAAGNEAQSQPGLTWYPAAYDGVLAVASVDTAGQAAADSNRGDWVDVAAPGEGLTAPSSGGGFVSVKGTSFATAVVSGVAALVRARYPRMPAREVEARIEGTAISPTGGRDDRFGAGIVDPYLALTAETTGPAGPPAGGVPDTAVRVVPVPRDHPLLGPRDAAATTAAAILLGAAAVATAAGVTVRRILARRHRGSGGRDGPVYRPVGPVPVDRLR